MAVDAAGSPRILIVRRDNIGDLACTTPLLKALRAQLPRAWLGALVTTYNAEVLARNPAPDDGDIDAAMAGNICRCGTYIRIRDGIKRAARS